MEPRAHAFQGPFPGFDGVLELREGFDTVHTYVRHKSWGELSGEYMGSLCAIFEISCESVVFQNLRQQPKI